jgi:putative ABC transport system ATP-binding protein
MISFRNVVHHYGQRPVLRIGSMDIPSGSHIGIHGESGSGKTSLLHLISGLLTPSSGSVMVQGQAVSEMGEAARDHFRASHIGYVFQTFNLLDGFSALENVMLAQVFNRGRSNREQAMSMLTRVGLTDRAASRPSELSVGQQQRVCIARALVNDPPIVLADEPTGSLDPETAVTIMELLQEAASGKTLLMVTHDRSMLNRFEHTLDMEGFRA